MLRHLDLFSGIGGFALGLQATGHYQTQAFCEYDPWARKILAKNFPNTPIYPDIRTMHYDGPAIDILTGGYPCQPFSQAGRRRGEMDHRHLWPEMERIIQETRPTWVIGENVAGHITLGLDNVLADLEGQDYSTQAFIIPAAATGALHRRDRVWVIAHANSHSQPDGPINEQRMVANAKRQRCRQMEQSTPTGTTGKGYASQVKHCCKSGRGEGWAIEPRVGRVAHGIPNRMDRLRGLGNAVVPQVVEMIGKAIYDAHTAQPETTKK